MKSREEEGGEAGMHGESRVGELKRKSERSAKQMTRHKDTSPHRTRIKNMTRENQSDQKCMSKETRRTARHRLWLAMAAGCPLDRPTDHIDRSQIHPGPVDRSTPNSHSPAKPANTHDQQNQIDPIQSMPRPTTRFHRSTDRSETEGALVPRL